MYLRPFEAQGSNTTVNIAVTASNQVLAVNAVPVGNRTVRITNSGTQVIFIEFGSATSVAALGTSVAMLPNTTETFFMRNENTHLAVISSTTGSTMYVTRGEGV